MKKGRRPNAHGQQKSVEGKIKVWHVPEGKAGRWVSLTTFKKHNPNFELEAKTPEPTPEPLEPKVKSEDFKPHLESPDQEPHLESPDREVTDEPPSFGGGDDFDFFADLDKSMSLTESAEDEDLISEAFNDEGQGAKPNLSGESLLSILDMVLPRLVSLVLKKAKVSQQGFDEYKLTEGEKKELAGVAQECADTIKWSDSPWINLSIGYGFLVATKVKK